MLEKLLPTKTYFMKSVELKKAMAVMQSDHKRVSQLMLLYLPPSTAECVTYPPL